MKKSKIIKKLSKNITPHRLCRVMMEYDPSYFYCFPLKVNEKFMLGAESGNFDLDGYCIRRIKQMKGAYLDKGKSVEIYEQEGIIDRIVTPDVDISDWRSIFNSLQKSGCNIIIEHESLDDYDWDFYIGKIEAVKKHSVLLRYFSPNCVWDEKPTKIPYSRITSVTFGSRYVDVYSKYLPEI